MSVCHVCTCTSQVGCRCVNIVGRIVIGLWLFAHKCGMRGMLWCGSECMYILIVLFEDRVAINSFFSLVPSGSGCGLP